MAIIIGHVEHCVLLYCSQKLKGMILATFCFNRTALRATQPKLLDVLRSLSEDRIISHRADVVWPPRNCDLTALDYYLWGANKDKCYADKPETIDAFIREAIGEIQLHQIDVLKNWTDRVGE